MDKKEFLRGTNLFSDLTDAELDAVIAELQATSCAEGDVIFQEGDQSDAAFIVFHGRVELTKRVSEQVEKTIFVAHPGDVFGEMGMLDQVPRSATAHAQTDVDLVVLGPEGLGKLMEAQPNIGCKILTRLTLLLSGRLRNTTELYAGSVQWGIEISGARGLNFHDLIDDYRCLRFGMRGGAEFSGRILRVDESIAGHEVTIRGEDGQIVILPYHAIEFIVVGAAQLEKVEV